MTLWLVWLSGCSGPPLDDGWSTVSVTVHDQSGGATDPVPAGPRARVLGFEASWAQARVDAHGPDGPISVARLTRETLGPDRDGSTTVALHRGAYEDVRLWIVLEPTEAGGTALFAEGRQASTSWEVWVDEPLPIPVVVQDGLPLAEGDMNLHVTLDTAGWVSELDFEAVAEERAVRLPDDDAALHAAFVANVAASAEVSREP